MVAIYLQSRVVNLLYQPVIKILVLMKLNRLILLIPLIKLCLLLYLYNHNLLY